MEKKFFRVLLLIAIISLISVGCGKASEGKKNEDPATASPGAPVQGGEIHVAFEADPPSLDWSSSGSFTTANIAYHVFEQLFALDKELKVKPMLADNYTLGEDNKTYTIKLRENVKFHDGSIMKADDVIASIERWMAISRFGKQAAKNIESITKTDDTTVVVRTKDIYSPLLRFFAGPQNALVIMPAKVAAEAGNKPFDNDKWIIGTGPYQFESWKRGQTLTLKKFDGYVSRTEDWGGLTGKKTAYLDKIHFDMIKDPQIRVDGLRTGQYDFAAAVPQDFYEQLGMQPSMELKVNEMKKYLTVIPDKSEAPFDDPRLRQAINYALDKEKVGLATYGNPKFFKKDGALFFENQKDLYVTTNTNPYDEYNPEKAKQLMKEAGYDGKPIRLIASNSYQDHFKAAQIVVQQLKEVGFNVDIQTYEYTTYTQLIKDPKAFDLFIIGFAPVYDLPLTLWLDPSYAGTYKSEKMDEMLKRWNQTLDEKEQLKLLEETNQIVYDEMPVIKLINEIGLDAVHTRLKGYPNWIGMTFWDTWVEKE